METIIFPRSCLWTLRIWWLETGCWTRQTLQGKSMVFKFKQMILTSSQVLQPWNKIRPTNKLGKGHICVPVNGQLSSSALLAYGNRPKHGLQSTATNYYSRGSNGNYTLAFSIETNLPGGKGWQANLQAWLHIMGSRVQHNRIWTPGPWCFHAGQLSHSILLLNPTILGPPRSALSTQKGPPRYYQDGPSHITVLLGTFRWRHQEWEWEWRPRGGNACRQTYDATFHCVLPWWVPSRSIFSTLTFKLSSWGLFHHTPAENFYLQIRCSTTLLLKGARRNFSGWLGLVSI